MTDPRPTPNPIGESWTESVGSPIFDNAVRVDIPPERRKIDPSTVGWPEGVPKPWEQIQPPAEGAG